MPLRVPFRLAPLLLTVLAIGCEAQKPVARVTGKVTFEGQSVEKGAITFFPLDGKSPTAGSTIVNGEYDAIVSLGEMKVAISAPKIVGKRKLYANNPRSPEMDLTVEALPERYNEKSSLKVSLSKSVEKHDFDLKK